MDTSLTAIGGVPHVAWRELGSGVNFEVRVGRLNAAGNDWEEIAGSASPINHGGGGNTFKPRLVGVGGVPYVAWSELDSSMRGQIRVSRPNATGNDWEEVVGGASPINRDSNQTASDPSLAALGGVPFVAWTESDTTNAEIRVSRLNASGTDWEEPWTGVSASSGGINHSTIRSASQPNLAVIGGVLHVAWREDDNTNDEIRVSRLNGSTWQQVEGGSSPINESNIRDAAEPSLADVGGVPYVAWQEDDGTNEEVRVSRLNGADWQQVVGGASPINQANNRDGESPSLAGIGGVAYVAWHETDATNEEIRVSRLNGDGTSWEQVVGGPSPINQANNRGASEPSLTGIGGVPYVSWAEADASNNQTRVSRLEPELTAPAALATDTGAVLLSQVSSFGVPYPVAFEYGTGGVLGSRTTPTTTSGGEHGADTVAHVVGGLAPGTEHSYRAIGFDGTYPIAPGTTTQFTTAAAPTPPTQTQTQTQTQTVEVPGPPVVQVQTNTVTRLLVAVFNPKLKARSGKRVTVDYVSTGAASATLEVLKGRTRIARVTGKAKAGRNKIAWNGKQGRKKAKAGKYTLRLSLTGGDGQTATDRATLTVKR